MTPRVSVVMPAYNAHAYIEAAIGSVLAQTMPDWELVVVDDASTDDTADIIAAIARREPRVRLLRAEKNGGVSAARNLGIQAAVADWVAFLDSDDLWQPDKLAGQLALLAEKPGTDLVYTGYYLLRGDETAPSGVFSVPETTTLSAMLKRNVISTSGALLRRALLLEYPFRSDVAHEDLMEWLTLLRAGAVAAGLDRPLHTVRVARKGSRSGDKLSAARQRFRLYRQFGLSWPAAAYNWLCYAVCGVLKYAALAKKEV